MPITKPVDWCSWLEARKRMPEIWPSWSRVHAKHGERGDIESRYVIALSDLQPSDKDQADQAMVNALRRSGRNWCRGRTRHGDRVHLEEVLPKLRKIDFLGPGRVIIEYEEPGDTIYVIETLPLPRWRSATVMPRNPTLQSTPRIVKSAEFLHPELAWDEFRGELINFELPLGAIPADETRRGPKGGENPVARLAWELAQEILNSQEKPPPGHGRLMKLARLVNRKLAVGGVNREDDSIRKVIGPGFREWEAKNPDE